jgi:hypothetical protein
VDAAMGCAAMGRRNKKGSPKKRLPFANGAGEESRTPDLRITKEILRRVDQLLSNKHLPRILEKYLIYQIIDRGYQGLRLATQDHGGLSWLHL